MTDERDDGRHMPHGNCPVDFALCEEGCTWYIEPAGSEPGGCVVVLLYHLLKGQRHWWTKPQA